MFRTFPIPCERGHDVVYGLARGRGKEIYLAPSNEFAPGLCADVYAFDGDTERFRKVIDVREATGFRAESGRMPHSKVHLCLQATAEGRAFAATHFTAPAVGQTSFDAIAAFRGGYAGTYLLEYDPAGDRVVSHGLLVPGEGARIACLDERHGQYYFLSYPRNHLFRYDIEARRLHDLGRMGQENAFGLDVDLVGDVYTSDDLGRFWRYSLARDRLEALDLHVPLVGGRSRKGNYIRRMAVGADGCFYGCANKGARFFRLDPQRLALEDYGVLVGGERMGEQGYPLLPPAKAIAPQADGSLLIAFGGDGVYPHTYPVPVLVRFEPQGRKVTELGEFVSSEDGVPAWIPQCAVGTYFGLQQTVGQLRLWRYDGESRDAAQEQGRAYVEHCDAVERQPFGASVEGAAKLPFVPQGIVQMQELGWEAEDRVIPAGETAVGALAMASDLVLYGLTVGRRSHLFAYRPRQQNRFTENYEVHPWDLGVVGDGPVAAARIFSDPERKRLLLALLRNDAVEIWSYPLGAEAAAYRGVYHSVPHGPAVRWAGKAPWGKIRTVEGIPFARLSYSGADDRFVAADVPQRALPENETMTAQVRSYDGLWAVGGAGGTIAFVAAGESDQPVRHSLSRAAPVRALAWGRDGTLWGFAGGEHDIGSAFRVRKGALEELGILQTPSQPRFWTAHRCDAIAAGPDGEAYFGEFDRIAHLFRVSG